MVAVSPDCMAVDLDKVPNAPVVKAGFFEVRCIERGEGFMDLYVLAYGDPNIWTFRWYESGGEFRGFWLDDQWSLYTNYSGVGGFLYSGPK